MTAKLRLTDNKVFFGGLQVAQADLIGTRYRVTGNDDTIHGYVEPPGRFHKRFKATASYMTVAPGKNPRFFGSLATAIRFVLAHGDFDSVQRYRFANSRIS